MERATGVQMALVTLSSLDGNPIEDVANDLFRKWGVGKKGQDNGILLLLAVQDRRDRIEVGYGLEPILPDGFVGSTLRELRPYLREQRYGQAMLAAAEVIGSTIAKAKGVTLDTHLARRAPVSVQRTHIPWPAIIFGLFILFWLLRSWGGGGGGFLAGILLGNLLGGGRRGGWGDGGGFGGDSGGGGFGGFGGGDSGGGGASSDW